MKKGIPPRELNALNKFCDREPRVIQTLFKFLCKITINSMIDVSFWCPLLSACDHRPARNYRPVRDHRLVRNHRLSWESFRKKKQKYYVRILATENDRNVGLYIVFMCIFFCPWLKGSAYLIGWLIKTKVSSYNYTLLNFMSRKIFFLFPE